MPVEPVDISASACPHCGGTGWELVDDKGVRPCECKRALQSDQQIANARIPRQFQKCTLENFEGTCVSVQRALMNSKKYVSEFVPGDIGLLFLGSCGVGKTHLAIAVLKELIKNGIPGLFYDFRDLLK